MSKLKGEDELSEMVERVARAICRDDFPKGVEAGEFIESNRDKFPQEYADWYRSRARDVIKAMREPTDAMEAAAEALDQHYGGGEIESASAYAHYQAMIDEALK